MGPSAGLYQTRKIPIPYKPHTVSFLKKTPTLSVSFLCLFSPLSPLSLSLQSPSASLPRLRSIATVPPRLRSIATVLTPTTRTSLFLSLHRRPTKPGLSPISIAAIPHRPRSIAAVLSSATRTSPSLSLHRRPIKPRSLLYCASLSPSPPFLCSEVLSLPFPFPLSLFLCLWLNGPLQAHVLADVHHMRFETAERLDGLEQCLVSMKNGGGGWMEEAV